MRIEVSAGGICGTSALDFSSNLQSYLSETEGMISSFQLIKNDTYNLSGGTENLGGAIEEVEARIREEENKHQQAVSVQRKTDSFIELACRVDQQVASSVDKNKDAFYRQYPKLSPVSSNVKERKWYEDALDWLCNKGEKFVDGVKQAWDGFKDTVKKAWNGLVEFYYEHKKIIDTILIVVGAICAIVAVVATGGVALVPLLSALGFSTATAIAISSTVAVIAVVSTVGSSTLNIIDTWYEIDNPIFNTFQKALNITSTISNMTYSLGHIYNSFKGYKMFSRVDWNGYPEGAPKPTGYYRVLDGEEYDTARRIANTANSKLHRLNPQLSGLEIHEIHPVKFGGSPTNINNKLFLTPDEHAKFTTFWNSFMKGL